MTGPATRPTKTASTDYLWKQILTKSGLTDIIENYTVGSGLQWKGDGNWQFNWATPISYKNTCRVVKVTLGDGSVHLADFKFKP